MEIGKQVLRTWPNIFTGVIYSVKPFNGYFNERMDDVPNIVQNKGTIC